DTRSIRDWSSDVCSSDLIGTLYSPDITPDKQDGIGHYTLEDFDNAVRYGIRKDGKSLYPAMPFPDYAVITEEDIAALYAYFMHRSEERRVGKGDRIACGV